MKEELKNFYSKINKLDDWGYLNYRLKYELATVISGIKPAATVNLTRYQKQMGMWQDRIFLTLDLDYMILRSNTTFCISLVYKKNVLNKVIQDYKIKKFLEGLGYGYQTLEEALMYLKYRYTNYHCPHELGIFLGIPLEEVREFIDNPNKKCLLCGYWKVYINVKYAQKIFKQYDEVKNKMLNNLLKEIDANY